ISGWDVTSTTDEAMDSPSTFSEEIQRAKWVARIPPISAMMAASRRGIRRSVFSRRRTPLRTKIVAPMINVAMARRYRAIVMGGEVLHVMKIEANDTETTARAIAAYGPPRIDSGPDRRYLTPVARSPQAPCSPQPAQGLSPFRPYRAIEGIHAAERHQEDRRHRRGHDGGGHRPGLRGRRLSGDDAGHRAALRRRWLPPDPGAAPEAGGAGQDGAGRGRRGPLEDPRGRPAQGGGRRRTGGHRGGLREDGDQEGTLRGTGSPLPALGRVRLEHVIAEHHGDGDRDETGGPHRRQALLQPRAGHEARRGDPRHTQVQRDHAADRGPMREAREGGRRSERVARVRREPAPRADDERGVQPPPGRRREPGGHRQGDEARHEHADGAARTRGLHRPRHRPRRDGGAVPGDWRPEVPSVDAPPKIRSGGAAREEGRPRSVRLPKDLTRIVPQAGDHETVG